MSQTRRAALIPLAAALLAGCAPTRRVALETPPSAPPAEPEDPSLPRAVHPVDPGAEAVYASLKGEPFPVAALDVARIDPRWRRTEVAWNGPEAPGTIVVDPAARHLFLVEAGGRARRYGVGVGVEGMAWSGTAYVNFMREWPDWYPTAEMIARRPDIRERIGPLQSGMGMRGGPENPVGARGLYLWRDGRDTLYRIHGTVEPYSIGQAVSSGCIRMVNQDVIDLYSRVRSGTKVVVLPTAGGGSVPGPVAAAPSPAPSPYALPPSEFVEEPYD